QFPSSCGITPSQAEGTEEKQIINKSGETYAACLSIRSPAQVFHYGYRHRDATSCRQLFHSGDCRRTEPVAECRSAHSQSQAQGQTSREGVLMDTSIAQQTRFVIPAEEQAIDELMRQYSCSREEAQKILSAPLE